MKILFYIGCFIFISCNEHSETEVRSNSLDDHSSKETWYDPMIVEYIKNSKNKLIELELMSNHPINWKFERMEKINQINYHVIHITTQSEPNIQSSILTTIYIDSAHSQLMEYDITHDKIIPWNSNVDLK